MSSVNNDDDNTESAPLIRSKVDDDDEEGATAGCAGHGFCSPKSCIHRYFPVLILICFLSFGSYFCYDNPAALQKTMEKDLVIDNTKYMAFYSFYSWPNVVLCMFGGFLIDRVFGLRLGAIIFCLFVTGGQILFALGSFVNSYWMMCAARFVFGIGGESLAVAQNTIAVKWFSGQELNMVFGLQLSFSRVGSTVNMNIMQPIYDAVAGNFSEGYKALGMTLFIGALVCVFSLLCAFALLYFDKRADRILQRGRGSGEEEQLIKFRDILTFPLSFWLMSIICVAYYVAVFNFISLGELYYEMKYGYTPAASGFINSLVYILSAAASPVFGFLIDKTGKNVFWVILGIVLTLCCYFYLAFTLFNPYVPVVMMGLAYSILASALWPMVSLIIPTFQLGTAYGIMQAIQNLGLASIALAAGALVDNSGYLILEVFFMASLCVALITAVLLYMVDAAKDSGLNYSSKNRARIEKEKKEKEEEKKPIQ